MYDELVEDLRRMANTWLAEEYKVCAEAVRFLMREAADAIEELAKDINVPRWIPVTERLPEEDGKYLTVYKSVLNPPIPWIRVCWFAKNLRKVDKYEFPKKKPGFYESDSEYGYFEVSGITHWMPLPQTPKTIIPEEGKDTYVPTREEVET